MRTFRHGIIPGTQSASVSNLTMDKDASTDTEVSSDDHEANIVDADESEVQTSRISPTTPPSIRSGKRVLNSLQPELTVGYTNG